MKKAVWVGWLLALAMLSLVIWQTDWQQVWGQLSQLQASGLLALLVANMGVLMVLNGRWFFLLWHHQARVSFWRLWSIRIIGAAISYLTPGPQFGGEPAQIYLLVKGEGVVKETAVTSVTLDRTFELIANFSFLLLGVVLSASYLEGSLNGFALTSALGLLAMPISLLFALTVGYQPLSWAGKYLPSHRAWVSPLRQTLYRSEQQIAQFCRQTPTAWLFTLLLSFVGWMALIGEYWLMIRVLNVQMSFVEVLVALTAVRISLLLPAPSGIGTIEASQFLAFQALGYPPEIGLSLSLLIRARDVAFAVLGMVLGKRFTREIQL